MGCGISTFTQVNYLLPKVLHPSPQDMKEKSRRSSPGLKEDSQTAHSLFFNIKTAIKYNKLFFIHPSPTCPPKEKQSQVKLTVQTPKETITDFTYSLNWTQNVASMFQSTEIETVQHTASPAERPMCHL